MDVFRILRSSGPLDSAQPDGPVSERDADTPRPETIGTHVEFLPRDPQWAFVHWQIDTSDLQRALARGAKDLCLRVADVTGLIGGAAHPQTLQEIVVEGKATEWYLPVPVCDRDYRVELGYRTDHSGGWISLACSSVARMPGIHPSQRILDRYAPFTQADGAPMAQGNAGPSDGDGRHERLYQRGAGVWSSGRSDSGSGGVPRRRRPFWLVVDAELIVYGATDPAARLTIHGKPVPLSVDGTFRLEMAFPDGQQIYPIQAVTADGLQRRSTTLEVQRRTPLNDGKGRAEEIPDWFGGR